MSDRKSSRNKKVINYGKLNGNDENDDLEDDDFQVERAPVKKRQKVYDEREGRKKNETSYLKENNQPNFFSQQEKRIPVEERVFQRNVKQALNMSKQDECQEKTNNVSKNEITGSKHSDKEKTATLNRTLDDSEGEDDFDFKSSMKKTGHGKFEQQPIEITRSRHSSINKVSKSNSSNIELELSTSNSSDSDGLPSSPSSSGTQETANEVLEHENEMHQAEKSELVCLRNESPNKEEPHAPFNSNFNSLPTHNVDKELIHKSIAPSDERYLPSVKQFTTTTVDVSSRKQDTSMISVDEDKKENGKQNQPINLYNDMEDSLRLHTSSDSLNVKLNSAVMRNTSPITPTTRGIRLGLSRKIRKPLHTDVRHIT